MVYPQLQSTSNTLSLFFSMLVALFHHYYLLQNSLLHSPLNCLHFHFHFENCFHLLKKHCHLHFHFLLTCVQFHLQIEIASYNTIFTAGVGLRVI